MWRKLKQLGRWAIGRPTLDDVLDTMPDVARVELQILCLLWAIRGEYEIR